jgi:hypothetical protein
MRNLTSLPLSFDLYDNYKRGGDFLRNVKRAVAPTWRHSIRSRGGFWLATCEYNGEAGELEEMFTEGMLREISVDVGGSVCWQGMIVQQDLTLKGAHYIRSWAGLANRTKVIYSRIGDNLLTNGSAESAAWADIGTPTTNERSTTWVSDGVYSDHIITDEADEGATIESAYAITAGIGYTLRLSTNLISGTWALRIIETGGATVFAQAVASTAGLRVLTCYIDPSNVYAGNIDIVLVCTSATGEIYGDAGVFQESPTRAETGWYQDATSQSEYGTIEDILLEAGMSDDSAIALAETQLSERSWVRTVPPNEYKVEKATGTKLKLTLAGYVYTLRNKFTTTTGTAAASSHVASILSESEFVTAGIIQPNTMDFMIDDRAPMRGWEVLNEITRVGDTSGNRWNCGVYGNRVFDYGQADMTVQYRMVNGLLYNIAGGLMEPWFTLPGLVRMDDMIAGPVGAGETADDARNVYIEEVEFSVADYLAGGYGMTLRRAVRSE